MILLALDLTIEAEGQELNTGIYFTMPCPKRGKVKTVVMDAKQKVCLTNEPVLSWLEFESISDLQSVQSHTFFYLRLSPEGFRRLLRASNALDNQLALVLDNDVIFIIDPSKTPVNEVFKVQADKSLFQELLRTHAKLSQMISAKE